jgi:putative ABC transport system permease protein
MPEWTNDLRARLARLSLAAERAAEIEEELSQHLDERHAELLAEGHADAEARRIALAELDAPVALEPQLAPLRQARVPEPASAAPPPGRGWAGLLHDLRHALRLPRAQPLFAAVAILTLALGIGANTAMFALVDASLLRPLPLPEPDRVVAISERTGGGDLTPVSPLNLRDWQQRSRAFEHLAGAQNGVGGMVMTGADGTAETVSRQWVTAGIFDALGVRAIVGRTFSADDDRTNRNAVVLNETFWRARYGADPAVVGTEVRLDGEMFAIVGVVPSTAELMGRSNLWALAPLGGMGERLRGAYFLRGYGLLAEGATRAAASAELGAIAATLAAEHPATNAGRGVHIEALHDQVVGDDLRRTAMLFLGVVGFVLLICCANVASLLLARAGARARELALRAALGASRVRIVRQLLVESALLALAGGAAGLLVAAAILALAPAVVPDGLLPPGVAPALDLRVAAFCAAASLAVGLAFGLLPAWQATTGSPARVVAGETRGSTARGGRLREWVVVGEVATAVALLVGAGLLLRTLAVVDGVDRGYRASGVLSMLVDPISDRYPTPTDLLRFYDDVEREIAALPGVARVAWATTLPLGDSSFGQALVAVDALPAIEGEGRHVADYQIVGGGYFDAVDLPLQGGRAFDARDRADSPPVAIVNEAFVRRHFAAAAAAAGDDSRALAAAAIGRRVAVRLSVRPDAPVVAREIVGVARQVRGRPDDREDFVQVYVPLAQNPVDDIFLLVRPRSGSAAALADDVRRAIGRVDTERLVGIRDVLTLEDVAADATARHRFRATLVAAFAGIALLLAMAGVFGALACSVQQRRRDFGVRLALGAAPRDVFRLVLRDAARMLALGIALGLAIAAGLGQWLSGVLYGVQPLDPASLAGALLLLLAAAGAALALPAWRAARVDPVVVLRGD